MAYFTSRNRCLVQSRPLNHVFAEPVATEFTPQHPELTMRRAALLLCTVGGAAAFVRPPALSRSGFAVSHTRPAAGVFQLSSSTQHDDVSDCNSCCDAPVRRTDAAAQLQLNRSATAAAIGLAILTSASPALAAVPEWIAPTRLLLDPLLIYLEFAFVCRIVLSWYPKIDLNKAPQNFVAWPTEPVLKPTRAVVPPAFGVDISPIVWVMIMSFTREVFLGQQGILTLLAQKG